MEDVTYLDNAATTPMAPEVLEAMLPWMTGRFGNPSAGHQMGRQAREALEEARAEVAEVLGCRSTEIVFTSGGTESDNHALRGALAARWASGSAGGLSSGGHVVTTAIEHEAVGRAMADLSRGHGVAVSSIGVDPQGLVSADAILAAVRPDTVVVSVMLASNQVGTVQPIAEIARGLRQAGHTALLHTDAVQAPLWLPIDVSSLGVDLLSLSAHKFAGPKGVGVLVVREAAAVAPIILGGGQERGHRAGTQNVAGAVGLATALQRAAREREGLVHRTRALAARLVEGLGGLDGVCLTGHRERRLPGIVSMVVAGVRADVILYGLDMAGICASSASACASGSGEPSPVLLAMGIEPELARGALRFSMGWGTTQADIDRVLATLPDLVHRARAAGAARADTAASCTGGGH